MELETAAEWTEGDICDDKRKVELAYGREKQPYWSLSVSCLCEHRYSSVNPCKIFKPSIIWN